MKKLIFILLVFCSLSVKAQFAAGFGQADPDAWFDKEPYFWCQNQTYYSLVNVSLVFNNDKVYTLNGTWASGGYITLGKDNGISLSSGDIVAIYVGNQCIGTWVCPKSPSMNLPRVRGGGKADKAVLKTIWKYAKKIR